jgi:phage terminase large subunit
MAELTVQLPEKMGFLFEPARYKVAWGGRGGGKSHSIAKALLIKGMEHPLRVLCAREFQKSIGDSVHKLLADQIKAMGLESFYEVQQTIIKGRNGTEFTFHGLKHNIANIKSVEGSDIAWVEEAHTVSKTSWETLIPTIRKEGSEIWISFNPELEEDETYKRFVLRPPASAKVVKINHSDNPWFPEVLRQEMEDLRDRDPDAYLHVWEGNCRQMLEGAIYAQELRKATNEGRVTNVPYDPAKPCFTFWDLGWADKTSIIIAQSVGSELRVIDYIENRHKPVQWYMSELQAKGYVYAKHWLPHDAQAKTLAAPMSVEQILKNAGFPTGITPKLSLIDGINAGRTVFNRCWFDANKCADLIQSLRHYRYEVDPNTGKYSQKPEHDEYSHGADAFRYLAVNSEDLRVNTAKPLSFRREFA